MSTYNIKKVQYRQCLCICVFKKGAISPKSLHIATSHISQGQNWCFVVKKVQYRLCLCLCVFKMVQYRPSHCIMLHLIYHKDKTGVVYSERCSIDLSLCILLHPIYHKNKTGVVYSKRCNIGRVDRAAGGTGIKGAGAEVEGTVGVLEGARSGGRGGGERG